MPMRERRVFLDTEFIDDGKSIELISIGMIKTTGRRYYAESEECDLSRCNDWLKANVVPYLTGPRKPRATIAKEIIDFVGPQPEFWAYYADYDWVALCQLYGPMIDLPKGWPLFCLDLKQQMLQYPDFVRRKRVSVEHNALADACQLMFDWQDLQAYGVIHERKAIL